MESWLVTGWSGFIGSHLVPELLRKGISIRVLTRQANIHPRHAGIEVFPGDLTKPASLSGAAMNIHTIIHAAGHAHATSQDAGLHRRVTVEGSRHLLQEAESKGVRRFVFISSIKAMPEPGDRCLDETEQGLPEDEYGRSRHEAEKLVLESGRRTGMHVSILRPALVYGPGCKGNLSSMLRWVDRGVFPPVPDTGSRRSMVDVRDLVRAILLAAELNAADGKIYIITDGQRYSTRRIYEAMCSACGRSVPHWSAPAGLLRSLGRMGDIYGKILRRPALFDSAVCARLLDSACYRSKFAEAELGFRPVFRFEDALPAMVAEYRRSQSS